MIKNFLFVLKRFKTSSILNILGLSVAFAVFIIHDTSGL
jgi:putative ABC transport system permease protein